MKLKSLIFSLTIFLSLINMSAQISHGGKPLSFENPSLKSSPVFNTPLFDYQQMIREDDEQNGNATKPFRYGKTHDVLLNPENSGVWQELPSGEKVWRLHVRSEKAFAVGLLFKDYHLNEGVKFFMYSADQSIVKGAFTSKNNKKSRVFSTLPLPGDELILELNIPKGTDYGKFEISGIVHDYKNVFGLKTGYGASGSCNVNVNCIEGDDWQNEKRSIVLCVFSGSLCTGVLVNNTRQDETPYLLTAEHCVSSISGAANAVFRFNYESESCIATSNPSYQSISSASLVATGGNLDFSLLELSTEPPVDYNVYYAGWNRATDPATNTVCIHHPSGDIKKISLDYNPPTTGNYGDKYVSNSHWWIHEWDVGTTEPGSSGSPIFDENHRIVGDLTGGDAYCSYSVNDYYAKFDMSWDYYSDVNQQLKAWLDPDNTGVMVLDGFDPNVPLLETDVKVTNVNVPSGNYCVTNNIVPSIVIQNKGLNDLTSVTINFSVNDGSVISENWIGNMKTGESETILLNSIQLPEDEGSFKVYISSPNGGLDDKNSNDTLVSHFVGETIIENLVITGGEAICLNSKSDSYYTMESGDYSWDIQDGEIVYGAGTDSIYVDWNDWGQREVNLTVTNLCGEYSAETFVVNPLEQSAQLEIISGQNMVMWTLRDDNGNLVYEGTVLPNSGSYSIPLCLMTGCYTLFINSESPCLDCSFDLTNNYDNLEIINGSFSDTQEDFLFCQSSTSGIASFNVYPNPSKDIINIEANFIEAYENAVFSIYNLNGAVVTPENLLNGRTTVNISELRKGYYILRIKSDYGEFTKKFVKP
ncbi:MAG: T9SS type A sorting domain-containing protein [Bacteroidota bacterium]